MENAPDDKRKSRSKSRSVEAAPLAEAEKSPGHIGHMLMTASETAPVSHTGKSALEAARRSAKALERSVERSLRPMPDKRVETLSRAELLNLSEQVTVDGSSLRQIYETHLVGERGLRRLIDAHLHGEDLKKALRLEIMEREIDFERDPAMRDMAPSTAPAISQDGATTSTTKATKTSQAVLNKMLEQAATEIQDSNEEAAFFKARALYEAQQLQQHKQQRRWIDVSLAFAIAILVVLVIVLLNRR